MVGGLLVPSGYYVNLNPSGIYMKLGLDIDKYSCDMLEFVCVLIFYFCSASLAHDNIVIPPKKRPRVYRLDFPPHLDVPHHVPLARELPPTGDDEYLAGTHRQMGESRPEFENFEELVERLGKFSCI